MAITQTNITTVKLHTLVQPPAEFPDTLTYEQSVPVSLVQLGSESSDSLCIQSNTLTPCKASLTNSRHLSFHALQILSKVIVRL